MDRRAELEHLHERLRALLAKADDRTGPAISRELRAVLVELEKMPIGTEKVTADELRTRRTARQADAANRARASGGK